VTEPLILALPSKGRLKDQTEDWLADCGLALTAVGGARGYAARLAGFDDVQVRLASAADIATALAAGDVHLGITGEDLLGELTRPDGGQILFLHAPGFGRADLVVATPRSWIDVATMADLEDVAHRHLARGGRRMRIATKYPAQTRAFFARHGVAEYRLIDSGGATEGAPASGAAEIIVDITTSGATLAANGLKVLTDGVILMSQARLTASLGARWDPARLAACRRLLGVIEARARGKAVASLVWPPHHDRAARAALAALTGGAEGVRANGVLLPQSALFAAAQALTAAGVGPISATHPAYVFEPVSEAASELARALGLL
jgi:ATP phosphoribosyltransferase